jgi:hypothetical protein
MALVVIVELLEKIQAVGMHQRLAEAGNENVLCLTGERHHLLPEDVAHVACSRRGRRRTRRQWTHTTAEIAITRDLDLERERAVGEEELIRMAQVSRHRSSEIGDISRRATLRSSRDAPAALRPEPRRSRSAVDTNVPG